MPLFDYKSHVESYTSHAMQPASEEETISSIWDLTRDSSLTALNRQRHEHYVDLIRTVEDETGQKLNSPYKYPPEWRKDATTRFYDAYNKLRETYPNLPPVSPESIDADIQKQMAARRQRRAEVEAREPDTFGRGALAFGTAMLGYATADPYLAGSMIAGAPAAMRTLAGIATEAAINAGIEATIQGSVAYQRAQIGDEPLTLAEGATAVGAAGLAGGLFAGAARGVAHGSRALVRKYRSLPPRYQTPAGDAAAAHLDSLHSVEASNPFGDTPRGHAQHAARYDVEVARLLETSAVGRVLRAQEDILNQPAYPRAVRASAEETAAVARAQVPELTARVDKAEADLPVAQEQLKVARQELEKFEETYAKTDTTIDRQIVEIRAKLADATDRRKIKRLERKLGELEKKQPKSGRDAPKTRKQLEKKVADAEERVKAARAERTAARRARKQATKGIAESQPMRTAEPVARRIEETYGEEMPQFSAKARGMAEAAEAVVNRVDRSGPVAPPSEAPRTVATKADEVYEDVAEEALTEEADAALRRAITDDEGAGDELVEVVDLETGAVKQVPLRDAMQEIDDEVLTAEEFAKCISGVISG